MDAVSLDFTQGRWLNEPPVSERSPTALTLETGAETDFWQQTHYGFERATGHALLFDVPPPFAAEITLQGVFGRKYEQAGLLLWGNARHWVKAGVEVADGRLNLAVVVTRERSDWSMVPVEGTGEQVMLRLTATGSAVIVHARKNGRWQILRVADFAAGPGTRLGPMACSPQSAGLRVEFRAFRLLPMPEDPLYLSAEN